MDAIFFVKENIQLFERETKTYIKRDLQNLVLKFNSEGYKTDFIVDKHSEQTRFTIEVKRNVFQGFTLYFSNEEINEQKYRIHIETTSTISLLFGLIGLVIGIIGAIFSIILLNNVNICFGIGIGLLIFFIFPAIGYGIGIIFSKSFGGKRYRNIYRDAFKESLVIISKYLGPPIEKSVI